MAKYFAVVKNEEGNPVVSPFLTWIRANQAQFDNPIPTPNTHSPFGKVVQLGWIRRDYNGDVYGIKPDENGDVNYSEPIFENGALPDPEPEAGLEDVNDIIQDVPLAMSFERDLQRTLRLNINSLENGLEIIDGGFERQVLNGGRIDILCKDQNENLVVIELKAGKGKPEVLAQILDYMADLRGGTESPVRGIIVAHDFDRRLQNAVTMVPEVQLKKYSIQFAFEDV
jgi:hypothetical protein